jgi:hypothetical protein
MLDEDSTCRRRRSTVPAWKKSTARIVFAWASRNARQACPDRLGSGIDARVFEDLPHR